MSWSMWGQPMPTVTPDMMGVGSYTPEQWAAMQQQNWQQWTQWQQQYAQWQSQYGEKYAEQLKSLQSMQNEPQPPLPPQPAELPPPPPDNPPPPPPHENNQPLFGSHAQGNQPPRPVPPVDPHIMPSMIQSQGKPMASNSKPAMQPTNIPHQTWNPPPNQQWNQPPSQHWNAYADNSSGPKNPNNLHGKSNDTNQNWNKYNARNENVNSPANVNKPRADITPVGKKITNSNDKLQSLYEEEKLFDVQFKKWEEEFEKWKEQNVNHPDKQAYREYEMKFEACRAQLMERREQMKAKRMAMLSEGSQSVDDVVTDQVRRQPLNSNLPSGNLELKTNQSQNYPLPSHSDETQDTRYNADDQTIQSSSNFLPRAERNRGIPGLDLVEDEEKKPKPVPLIDLCEDTPKEVGKFNEISKGIQNILGDQKILTMLSMVTQSQNIANNTMSSNQNMSSLVPQLGSMFAQNQKMMVAPPNIPQGYQGVAPPMQNSPYIRNPNTSQGSEPMNKFGNQENIMKQFGRQENSINSPGNLDSPMNKFGSQEFPGSRFGNTNKFSGQDQFSGQDNYKNKFSRQDEIINRHDNVKDKGPSQFMNDNWSTNSNVTQNPMNRPPQMPFNRDNKFMSKNQDIPPLIQNVPDNFMFKRQEEAFGGKRMHNIEERDPQRLPSLLDKPIYGRFIDDNRRGISENVPDKTIPNRFDNAAGRMRNMDDVQPRARFENEPPVSGMTRFENESLASGMSNQDKQSFEMKNQPFKNVPPQRPTWDSEPVHEPTVIVDYEHKPLRMKARDFIEPVQMFDYNHISKNKPTDAVTNRYVEMDIYSQKSGATVIDYQNKSTNRDLLDDMPKRAYPASDRLKPYEKERYDNYMERPDRSERPYDRRDRDRDRDRERPSRYEDRGREPTSMKSRYSPQRSRYSAERSSRGRKRSRERSYDRAGKDEFGRDRSRERGSGRDKESSRDRREKERKRDWPRASDRSRSRSKSPQKSNTPKSSTPVVTGIINLCNIVMIDDILESPGREMRPERIVIIMRGPPGSGKSYLAKLIKDREIANGGSAPRILSIDDYFMQESEETEMDSNGKQVKKQVMVYEYDEAMEANYFTSLTKAFKRTVQDGYFPFIIVDSPNEQLKHYAEMWNFARQKGFQVYICQLEMDAHACHKRNIHNRSLQDIQQMIKRWYKTPEHHMALDATTLLQSASIDDVQMEDADSNEDDVILVQPQEEEEEEDLPFTSKWDTMDDTDKLARLDGTSKPLRSSQYSMEDYLQLDDWKPAPSKDGKKTVRWADLEEKRKQDKMRAIGFVVGQTDWNRMTDPTQGSSALTQTKYIERVRKF